MAIDQEKLNKLLGLTALQQEYLRMKCSYMSPEDISKIRFISTNTVYKAFERIYDRLDISAKSARSRSEHQKWVDEYCECLSELDKIQLSGKNKDSDIKKIVVVDYESSEIITFDDKNEPLEGTTATLAMQLAIENDDYFNWERSYYGQKTLYDIYQPLAQIRKLSFVRLLSLLAGAAVLIFGLDIVIGNLFLSLRAQPVPTQLVSDPTQLPTLQFTSLVGVVPSPQLSPSLTITLCTISATADESRGVIRPKGVTLYSPNIGKGMLTDKVRSILPTARGLFVGYMAFEGRDGGVAFYNKNNWMDCRLPGNGIDTNVNEIAQDKKGNIWVATENNGVWMFDMQKWTHYTMPQLPSNEIFGIAVDKQDNVWAATYEGIAKFDGKTWITIYSTSNSTLISNRTHNIAFDSEDNIWIGYINKGVSKLSKSEGKWLHFTTDNGLAGNSIRRIITKQTQGKPFVLIASNDGGLTLFENDQIKKLQTSDGLPSNDTQDVNVDKHGRIWIATDKGVFYQTGNIWTRYHDYPTNIVAFGCVGCPSSVFDDDAVWTGLRTQGATHARVPFNEPAIDLVSVKFFRPDNSEVITPTFKIGEKFRVEISMRPRIGYQLTNQRGDALWILESEDKYYGAFPQMPVKIQVEPGQIYRFTDFDQLITAPSLPAGIDSQKITIRWQVWMFGRLTGPIVPMEFTVVR